MIIPKAKWGVYCEVSKVTFRSVESMDKYWRMKAHEAFDPIWQRKMKHRKKLNLYWRNIRNDAYKNLAKSLGKSSKETHMLLMNKSDCLRVIKYSYKRKKKHMRTDKHCFKTLNDISMKIPQSQNKEYFLIPEGEHLAILVSIIDLWTQVIDSKEYGPSERRRVRLTWELPDVMNEFKEGEGEKPALISQEYTFSFFQNATFRKHMQLFMWRSIKEDEVDNFDTSALLWKTCYLTIEHNASKDSTFANIFTIRKGDKKLKPKNTVFEFSLDNFNKEVFDSLSEKTIEKIRLSPEYQELELNAPDSNETKGNKPTPPVDDEDLPF